MRIGSLLSCAVLLAVAAPVSLAQEAYDFVVADGRFSGALPGQVLSRR